MVLLGGVAEPVRLTRRDARRRRLRRRSPATCEDEDFRCVLTVLSDRYGSAAMSSAAERGVLLGLLEHLRYLTRR
jgi:hypothetical protein